MSRKNDTGSIRTDTRALAPVALVFMFVMIPVLVVAVTLSAGVPATDVEQDTTSDSFGVITEGGKLVIHCVDQNRVVETTINADGLTDDEAQGIIDAVCKGGR